MGTLSLPAFTLSQANALFRHFDKGEQLLAKTDTKAGTGVIYVAGDSTGAIATRWPRRLMALLAADNTDANVRYQIWNDTTQSNGAVETIQAGASGSTPGIKTLDNFNRTGDLKGSTPNIGRIWSGSSNAVGDWTLDGSKAISTPDGAATTVLSDSSAPGDRTITLGGVTISTTGTGSSQAFRLYTKYADNANLIFAYININSAGTVSWGISKTIAGVNTTVISGAANPIAANTANLTPLIELTVSGTSVIFKVGSQTVVGTLTSSDVTALMNATQDGILNGPITSMSMDSFTVSVTGTGITPALSLAMYNGSMSGSTLTYQSTRLTSQCPVPPDVVLINSCHNYGSDTPEVYIAKLDTFIELVAQTWPNAGVVVMSQNPQKSPATNAAPHLTRLQAISSYCAKKDVGYVPVIEAFRAKPDLGVSLVRSSDGVHPTDNTDVADASSGTVATNGAQLWTRVVYGYLVSKRKTSAPTTP